MPDTTLDYHISPVRHRALGNLIQLQLAPNFNLRLTPAETSSLSFALAAVRAGISPEREIYMSPIASDDSFIGLVEPQGMRITRPEDDLELDWEQIGELAAALAHAIEHHDTTNSA